MQLLDVADEHVADRDADAADAVEQRDLGKRPACERVEVTEQHEQLDEIDGCQRERSEHQERERRAVLQLRTDARSDEVPIHRESVSHPAPPRAGLRS